jgi:hypothetical protein
MQPDISKRYCPYSASDKPIHVNKNINSYSVHERKMSGNQVDKFTHAMSRTLQVVVVAWALPLVNMWEDAGTGLINTDLPK